MRAPHGGGGAGHGGILDGAGCGSRCLVGIERAGSRKQYASFGGRARE